MKEIRTSSAIALEGLILTTDTLNESRVHFYPEDMQRGTTNENAHAYNLRTVVLDDSGRKEKGRVPGNQGSLLTPVL